MHIFMYFPGFYAGLIDNYWYEHIPQNILSLHKPQLYKSLYAMSLHYDAMHDDFMQINNYNKIIVKGNVI